MSRTIFALSFVILIACFVAVPEAAAQNVVIKLSGQVIIIPPQKVDSFKGLSGMASPDKPRAVRKKRKPFKRRDGVRLGGGTGLGVRGTVDTAATNQPTLSAVANLARQFKLTERPKVNPQLAFGPEEIHYWRESGLSLPELTTEFAAIRTVLDAADSQKVSIRDPEMLFEAADEFLRQIEEKHEGAAKDEKSIKSERLLEVGSLLCEGDTSETLIRQAWEGLNAGKGGLGLENLEKALACTKVTINTFSAQADEQQSQRLASGECKVPPGVNDKEAYFRLYAALGDVSAAWFIRGQVFSQQKRWKEAREAYKVVIDKYSCAYAWDPRGWFWRIAEGTERETRKLP